MRIFLLSIFLCLLSTLKLSAETITLIAIDPAIFAENVERKLISLSLSESIIAATTTHPMIKSAQLNLEIAKLAEKSAWSGQLPTVTISSNMVGNKATGAPQVGATLSAQQSLINLAGAQQKARQATFDTKIAQVGVNALQQQKRAATEELFLNTWLKQEEYKVLKKEFELAEKNHRTNKQKYDCGLLTIAELQKSIAQLSATQTKFSTHKNLFIRMLSELEEMIGIFLTNGSEENVQLDWAPTPNHSLNEVSFYLEKALKNRLEIEIHKLNYKKTRIDEKIAQGKLFPSVSAIGQYSYDYQPSNPDYASYNSYTKTNFFGGIQTTWNIFDGNLSRIEGEAARARGLKSSTDKELAQRKIEKEIKQLYNDLKITQQQAITSQAVLSSATTSLQSAQDAKNSGTITETALLGSSTDQFKTQFDCLNQIVTFQKQLFALNAACGYSLDNC